MCLWWNLSCLSNIKQSAPVYKCLLLLFKIVSNSLQLTFFDGVIQSNKFHFKSRAYTTPSRSKDFTSDRDLLCLMSKIKYLDWESTRNFQYWHMNYQNLRLNSEILIIKIEARLFIPVNYYKLLFVVIQIIVEMPTMNS